MRAGLSAVSAALIIVVACLIPAVAQVPAAADKMLEQACSTVGGKWHQGMIFKAIKAKEAADEKIKARLANCKHHPDRKQCRQQIRVEENVGAYFKVLIFWQCTFGAYLVDDALTDYERRTAWSEACEIEKLQLKPLQDAASKAGAIMTTAPHQMMLVQTDQVGKCDKAHAPASWVHEQEWGVREMFHDLFIYRRDIAVKLERKLSGFKDLASRLRYLNKTKRKLTEEVELIREAGSQTQLLHAKWALRAISDYLADTE